jgi:cyclomaltodextrinase
MEDNFQTPDWVKNAVFYQIFPDRFAKSDQVTKPNNLEDWQSEPTTFGFKGGDLLGVVEHLDYLSELGITAIYFNPIFQSTANHRYNTHDYLRVDPILGGDEAFKRLLEQAHQRGIRVVLDGVFNHASRGFYQFNHILENGEDAPYLDWFIVYDFPLNAYHDRHQYEAWADLPALPKFNTDNPQVRDFIFRIARYWLEKGIDGWRLDVPMEIDDDEFWCEFRQVVKETNPEAYIVGEIPFEAQRWLQGDQFDAVMNYQFTQACLGFFAGKRINREDERGLMGLKETPVMDAAAFTQRAQELLEIYPWEAVQAQLNLLSSHDMPRFITLASGDEAALKLATTLQMTYPGAPCVYYGDEIGMQGGRSDFPEASRAAFPWDRSRWNTGLLDYFKRVIAIRKQYPALRTGEFLSLHAEAQALVFLRRLEDQTLIVAINNGDQELELRVHTNGQVGDGTRWKDLLGGKSAQVEGNVLDGSHIPARSAQIFIQEAS